MLRFLLSGSLQKCFCFSPSGQAGSPQASLSAAPGSRLVMMAARGDTCRSQADRFLRTEPGQGAEPGSDSRPPPVTLTSLYLSWKRLRQQTLRPPERSPTLRCQLASLSLYAHGHGRCAKCSGRLRPHAGDLPTGLTCLPRTCCEPAPHRPGFPPASPTKNLSHVLTFCPNPRDGGSSSLACTPLLTLCSFWANPRPRSARHYLWVGDPAVSFLPTPPSELCPFPAPPPRRALQTLSSSAQEAISWNVLRNDALQYLHPICHSANTVGGGGGGSVPRQPLQTWDAG